MMLPMRPSHKESTCVLNVIRVFRQKRGNGLLATSGLLNGVFRAGPQRHVACWESIKVTDRFEEAEDGVTTIRERERFTQSLTLAYADGRTAILADRSKGDEERASTDGNPAVSQDCERHGN